MSADTTLARRLPLLRRMVADFETTRSLRPATAATMWAAYVGHAALTAWALTRRAERLLLPTGVSRVVGGSLLGAGTGLCAAGMGRFSGASEVTGTDLQALTTGGVYRYSRNPQYLGYVLALGGAGLTRRSPLALANAGVAAAVYAAWVPVEEEHLTATYGESYAGYLRSTGRWWGRHRAAHP